MLAYKSTCGYAGPACLSGGVGGLQVFPGWANVLSLCTVYSHSRLGTDDHARWDVITFKPRIAMAATLSCSDEFVATCCLRTRSLKLEASRELRAVVMEGGVVVAILAQACVIFARDELLTGQILT